MLAAKHTLLPCGDVMNWGIPDTEFEQFDNNL